MQLRISSTHACTRCLRSLALSLIASSQNSASNHGSEHFLRQAVIAQVGFVKGLEATKWMSQTDLIDGGQ